MSSMAMYRRWQFMAMEKNLLNIEHIVGGVSDSAVFSKRDGGDGWTISEVLGHLADFDLFFCERARVIAETDEPPPQPGSPQASVDRNRYVERDAGDVLALWKANRGKHLAYLQTLPQDDEAIWEKRAEFGSGRAFTLNDQVVLAAYHDLDHMHQIVKIIRA